MREERRSATVSALPKRSDLVGCRWILDGRRGGVKPHWVLTEAERLMIIPEEFRQCVAFAYLKTASDELMPTGTVFFVSDMEAAGGQERAFIYAVTARHVIEKVIADGSGGAVWLRLNTADGGSDWLELPLTMWRSHPSDRDAMWLERHDEPRFDVSACLMPPLDEQVFQFRIISTASFLDQEKIAERGIGPGDEVFFIGLFASHLGRHRNTPIVRCGSIAAIPDEPVETRLGPMDDALLVEVRSIPGLSGSPVFIGDPAVRRTGPTSWEYRTDFKMHLAGLVHGHWSAESGDTVPDETGNGESINSGIAIVAPARHILETLRQGEFMKIRAEKIRDFLQRNAPVMDEG
jgi:hypothetical protein